MPGSVVSGNQARPGFDPSSLLELVGGDREFLDEFIVLFEQDAARLVLEIRRAVAGADGAALERSAHSLKGMLSHFGESAALELSRRLEALGAGRDLAGAEEIESALLGEIGLIQESLARLVL